MQLWSTRFPPRRCRLRKPYSGRARTACTYILRGGDVIKAAETQRYVQVRHYITNRRWKGTAWSLLTHPPNTFQHRSVRDDGFKGNRMSKDEDLEKAKLGIDPPYAPVRRWAHEATSKILEENERLSPKPITMGIPASNVYLSIQALNNAQSAGLRTRCIAISPDQNRGEVRTIDEPHLPQGEKTFFELPRLNLTRLNKDCTRTLQLDEQDTECIMSALLCCDATIALSPTGSGKSTQIPQLILDSPLLNETATKIKIICSQPTPSLVHLVASKVISDRSGKQVGSVGYDLYEESDLPKANGSITYCTSAILLRRFLEDPDRFLSAFSHVIIDDVHESQGDTELALTLLRRGIRERKAAGNQYPKLILMSAAHEASSLVKYLGDHSGSDSALTVTELKLGGPAFEVQRHYLSDILSEHSDVPSECMPLVLDEEYQENTQNFIQGELAFTKLQASEEKYPRFNFPAFRRSAGEGVVGLAALTVSHLIANKTPGDILVFLPTKKDISKMTKLLHKMWPAPVNVEKSSRLAVLSYEQLQESDIVPMEAGCVRVVLVTSNIAPSVMLQNVTHVVDSGQIETNSTNGSSLKERMSCTDLDTSYEYKGPISGRSITWISQADAQARAALAGFAKGGHYYALYTSQREKVFPEHNIPGIDQSDLVQESLMLSAAAISYDPIQIFQEMPQPPRSKVAESAFRKLRTLDAYTQDNRITNLGLAMSHFSLHPSVTKSLLLGALFGCLEPMIILACLNPSNTLLDHTGLIRNRDPKQQRKHSDSDPVSQIEWFHRYAEGLRHHNHRKRRRAEDTGDVEHSTFLTIKERSQRILMTLRRLGVGINHGKGENIDGLGWIPDSLNFNKKNKALILGICLNTTHPNIAIWDTSVDGTQQEWKDASSYHNKIDPHSTVYRTARLFDDNPDLPATGIKFGSAPSQPTEVSYLRSQRKMLSYRGKRITGAGSDSRLLTNLEHVSMLSPMLAILFHPATALDPRGHIVLDGRMNINLSIEDTVDHEIESHANQILIGFRDILQGFCQQAFSQLNIPSPSSLQVSGNVEGGNRDLADLSPPFESNLRSTMVNMVAKVLEDDRAYWQSPAKVHSNPARQGSEKPPSTAKDELVTARRDGAFKVTADIHRLTQQAVQDEEKYDEMVSMRSNGFRRVWSKNVGRDQDKRFG
ncbi:hypothetical protein LTR84_012553 [Exophiala bonariae]|uniref:Helicase ATP-binding domain-containing protein n=1 Tax=Exophiala bonariae TaxID=1690606 RepID=A0AAV9NIR9_9EURO|nr:hypothetical protein LTR84_012553 [Exophiala bonariae]